VASNRIAQDNAILEVAPCKNREEGQKANSVLGAIVYSVADDRRSMQIEGGHFAVGSDLGNCDLVAIRYAGVQKGHATAFAASRMVPW